MKYYYKNMPIGYLTVVEEDGFIIKIAPGKYNFEGDFILTPLIKKTFIELDEYFLSKRKTFDIPYKLSLSSFSENVLNEIKKIPYGKTKTYGEIALNTGNKKASRAVGNALNKNPILIIIPCHRVIGKKDKSGGYKGGVEIKKMLLNLEENNR